jgi:signal transduction histidine kinase
MLKLRNLNLELENRNKDLGAFAQTVAHDLQSPLSLIIGYAELLEQDIASLPPETIQLSLQAIVQNGRKLSDIVDSLLLLAGIRQIEVELKTLHMDDIIAEVLQRVNPMIEEYEPQIILPETWPEVSGYAPWIEEVWANYISNALKYGGSPPQLELGADTQPEDGMVRFWIQDNGPGLTPEEQSRLFIPFTRLDQANVKGHGLGLSIVRRIVEKLGGEVGVESTGLPDRGSTFYFTLPGAA